MAHSHVPTWNAAKASGNTFDRGNYRGGGLVGTQQVSAQSLPGHTKLKFRAPEQDGAERNDSLQDLEQRERRGKVVEAIVHDKELQAFDDADDEVSASDDDDDNSKNDDQEDGGDGGKNVKGDQDSDDDDDSDDDEGEQIARELERIRKEREEKAALKEKENEELEALDVQTGNPLLGSSSSSTAMLKRRWDADVVFQNQANEDSTTKKPKRFINDTIRNDFHRNFLKRYIK